MLKCFICVISVVIKHMNLNTLPSIFFCIYNPSLHNWAGTSWCGLLCRLTSDDGDNRGGGLEPAPAVCSRSAAAAASASVSVHTITISVDQPQQPLRCANLKPSIETLSLRPDRDGEDSLQWNLSVEILNVKQRRCFPDRENECSRCMLPVSSKL